MSADQTAAPSEIVADLEGLRSLVDTQARLLDDQRFVEWLGLFAEDGRYCVQTHSNAREGGLWLIHDQNPAALKNRVAQLVGIYHTPRPKMTRTLSGLHVVDQVDDATVVRTSFVAYRTLADAESALYAVGHYVDTVVQEDEWRFREHRVVVDADQTPPAFAELL